MDSVCIQDLEGKNAALVESFTRQDSPVLLCSSLGWLRAPRESNSPRLPPGWLVCCGSVVDAEDGDAVNAIFFASAPPPTYLPSTAELSAEVSRDTHGR